MNRARNKGLWSRLGSIFLSLSIALSGVFGFGVPSSGSTGGSLYFSGAANSNLQITNDTDLQMGTGDFTIEWWQYQESGGGDYPRIFSIGSYPARIAVSLELGTFYFWAMGSALAVGSYGDIVNKWTHFAVSRSGSTLRVFMNGTQLGSNITNTTNFNATTPNLIIGNEVSSGGSVSAFKGNITNFHWIKGTAKYTSNFSVPTAPIAAQSNTKILLAASTAGTFSADTSGVNKSVSVSNVTYSTATPYALQTQTITFPSITEKLMDSTVSFTVSPTSNSGATPTVTSTTTAVCTVSGLTVSLISEGTCTLAANSGAGNGYGAATEVRQSFTVRARTGLVPLLGNPTYSAGTWTVPITNYDSNFTWTYSVSSGSYTLGTPSGSSLNVSITPSPGSSVTLSVTTSRTGYESASITSPALLYLGTCSPSQSTSEGYTILSFTASGSCDWTVPNGVSSADVLVVGGGGAGGALVGGGGGAGGYRYVESQSLTPGANISVTVGAGGVGTTTSNRTGGNGGFSSLGNLVVAMGGGAGGTATRFADTDRRGIPGGSGGGAASPIISAPGGSAGPSSQGNVGGTGTGASTYFGGGGGGAGGVGANASSTPGKGGSGTLSSITGSAICYATGGSGARYSGTTLTAAGDCGTGASPNGGVGGANGTGATAGTNNRGAGGGGSGSSSVAGANGGSGIVIVRYASGTLTDAGNPNVSPTSGTLKSISATWSAVSNASSYTIRLYSADGSSLLHTITGATGTSRTITGSDYALLADGTTYRVSVQAIGTGGYLSSNESGKVSVTTAAKLAAPGSLSVTAAAASALTVTFNAVSNASSYTAQLFDGSGNQIGSNYTNFTSGSRISGLSASTTYSVKVIAVGNGAEFLTSDPSSGVSASTSAANYLKFAGTASQMASTTAAVIPSTGDFTAEAWVSPSEYSASRGAAVIVSQGTSSGNRFYLKLNSIGKLVFYHDSAPSEVTCSNNPIPLDTWTHVAIAVSGTTGTCYVNGIAQLNGTVGTAARGSSFYIGGYSVAPSTAGTIFKGFIDEVKIWNVARTATQIANNMEVAPAANDSTLVAYYPLDATSGTTAIDVKGLNNLTLGTTMAWSPLIRTITYQAGTGGSGSVITDSSPSDHTTVMTIRTALLASGFNRSGHTIQNWNTAANGTGTTYDFSTTYSGSLDLTLHAQWETDASAPIITTQPIPLARVTGESVTFSVAASVNDGGSLSYQWQKDGVNISGATSATYTINSVASGDAGAFRVVVTNSKSGTTAATTSNAAKLVVAGTNYHFDAVSSSPGSASATGRSFRSSSAVLPAGSFTIEGWVRDKSTSTGQNPIFSQGGSNANRLTLHIIGTTNRTLLLFGSTANISGSTVMAKDKWHHFAVTYDGTTLRLYLNGVLEGSVNDTLNLTGTFFIGENAYYTGSNSAHFFHGKQDQVKIWSGVLSQSDIAASMYSYGNAGITDKTLRTLYDFNQQNSSTVSDVLGGFDLTSNGNGTSTTWPSSSLSVTFDEQGGSAVTDTTFDFYTRIASPSTTRANATFSGWSRTSTGSVVSFPYAFVPMESITLYGIWVMDTYSITLNKGSNGTGTNQTLTKTHGQALTLPDLATANSYFTRTGYTVGGWSTTDGGSQTHALGGSFTTEAATTLYPVWTGNTYTVTYTYNSADGGTRPATNTFTVGGSAITLPTPTRTGYTFDGWYAEVGLATSIGAAGASYSPSSNTTIYAKWIPNTYTITYAAGSSATGSNQTQTKTHAVDLTLPNSATANGWFARSGQTIVGWSTTDGGNLAHALGGTFTTNSATTLYPVWTCAAGSDPVVSSGLVLRLDADNACSTGTAGKWRDISGNSRDMSWVNTPTLGTDYGKYYEFVRSSSHYGTLTSSGLSDFTGGFSITFWARFDATGGGGWERILDIGRGDSNENIIVGREGNTNRLIIEFRRGSTETLECSSAIITDGQWAHFSITVNSSGNCVIYKNGTSQTLAVGVTRANPFLPNNIERTSNFIGDSNWAADAFFDGGIGDLALYNRALTSSEVSTNYSSQLATPATYTITLNKGTSGTGSNQTLTKTHGQALTLPDSATANSYFTRSGYSVTGWTTSDGGSQTHALGGSFTTEAATTLYPVWTGNTYTITYSSNGGSSASNGSFTVGGSGLTLPTVTRSGYTFAGWYEASDFSGSQLSSPYSPSQTRTVYAKWTANTYNVTYDEKGGSTVLDGTFITGGAVSFPTSPTRNGFTFGGWSATNGGVAVSTPYSPGVTSNITLYAVWTSTLAITTPSSGLSGTVGQAYTLSISTTGGSGTNSFSATGTLPSGLSINSSTGVISGTPSAAGDSSITVTVTDSSSSSKTTNSFTISIGHAACVPQTDTSSSPGFTILKFTTVGNCNWEVPALASSASVLVVAGGGGGAFGNNAGGGGAGEVLVTGSATLSAGTVSNISSISLTPGAVITIGIGSGGTSGAPTGSTATDAASYWNCCQGTSRPGGTGGNSSFGTIIAKGGGGGGGGAGDVVRVNGENGGSGGGGASGGTGGLAQSLNTYSGWTSFKNSGAAGATGGGGGAGSAGTTQTRQGGAGVSVLGITVAGGGGGWGGRGGADSLTDQVLGGNGRLTTDNWRYAGTAPNYTSAGVANTGTGGGAGAPGGSGIVVVRYQSAYVVTFNYNSATGGNTAASDTFQIGGTALTLPTPSRTGYTFAGWYEASDFSGSALGNTYSPTQTRTIYAKWTVLQSTITFNANDGTGSPATSTQSVNNGVATALTSNSFTRTGYTFAGWNTLANGTGTNYTNQQSVTLSGNLTLYAKWTANTYTVTYTYNGADGGTRPTTDSFTVGGSAITLPTPSRLGFVFGGWYAEVGLSTLIGAAGASYSPTADATIYAKWTNTLIVDLDATNSSSYSGTGTTWTNIAPGASPASATLDSAAMYSTQFGGVMNTTSSRKATTQTTSITFDNSVGFTMEVWVRFNAVNSNQGVASFDGNSKYINFYKASNAGMRWEVSGSNAITDTTVVAANTWYHFVGTCKNNTAVLYRNGVQAISSSGRTCTTSQNSTFLVGNIQGIQMDGSVSLFRFYTSALTADEVLTRYNATKSRTTFTVTYNYDSADGGNSTASATYANGDSAIVLPTPTKTNNTFAGWYSDAGKTVLVGNAGANYTPTGANSAITLYAKWTGNTSTVTFNANDGSGSPATSTQSISNGVATALTANAFTRTGYTFAGWNSLANGTGTNYTNQQSVTLTGNLTLYAKWTANIYTVTYTYNNADGGTRPATDSFTVGGAVVTLPTPTRTGYTFAGWYGEIGLSTLIGNAGAGYSPTANVTLYAKWTANNNTVTFKSNYVGGANDSTQTIVTAVATGLTSNSFTRAGYVFGGWNTLANGTGTNYTDGQSVTLTGALTLYAKWTAGTYTVTYNYNSATGGASVASGSFTTGGANLVLPVPTKTGYTFAGWYDDSGFTGSALASSITTTSSKTIYAKWTAATFTVLYEYNAATAGDSTASNTYTTGSTTITLPTPTKTGYTFAGWYEASNFSGSAVSTPYTTSQNRSLYAKWTAISYTVTYNANLVVGGNTISGSGSVPVNNNNYNIGQSFSVAANTGPLTRSGYTFAGWVTNEDGTGTAKNSGETITFGAANINLYPKWTANTYTIAYNLNGGSGDLTSAPTSWTVGNANVTLPSSGFTRTGYNFAGWSKTQGGSVINNSFNNIGNVTLYASWTLKTISYTFDKGTAAGQSIASWPSNSSATFGTTITLPTPSNTVTINSVSYQFFGWEYSGTTYQPGSTFTLSETAPTFVAQWVRLYDVRYAYAGGTHSVAGDTDDECVTASLCIQDQDITLRTAPVRPGYNFIGWRVQDTNTTKSAGALHRVIATGYLFYANWQAIDYDFSFNSSGGSDSHSSVTANVGQLVTMPNPGFRVGYTFAGWSPDNGTTKYTTGSTFTVGTASQAFVAYWTPNVYTVVYDWQGASGTPTPDASYTVGTGSLTLPLIGDRTKDGYTFGGWSETPGGTAVSNFTPTANDVLYAIWNDGNYTLSYDGRGASSGSGQGSVNRGSSVTLPTPVRAGFVFTGWYDDATAGNKIGNGGASHTPGRSRTLYARWVQRSLYGVDPATLESGQEYTASDTTGVDTNITHNPTSTSARVQIPSGALPAGTKVNVQYFRDTDRQSNLIPGNNSYFFSVLVSWLSGSGTSATVPNTNAGKPITVTLNNPSIKAGAMVYMVIGDQVTELGRATQDGTATVELTQDPEIVVAATAPGNPASVVASSGDQEATVSWAAPSTNGGAQIVSYTVTASPGNASCTTATTTCTVTGLTNGTAYTFSVVATNSVGSSTGASSASITPALATYTVTFNSNGGGNVSNGTFTSGGSVSEPSAPTRSGYTFDGWSTVLNSVASKVTFPYSPGVNNNITLYALWTQVQSSGGSGGSNTSPTVTPTPTPPVTPGPTAPPSQIGFKPTPPPTPVAETGPVGSIVGSSEKVKVVADAPSEKIIATAGSWKLEIKPPVSEEAEKPVTEKLELQLPVASKAEISGTGLQPNTAVEAWVFSTPRYIGTLKVGADGSFASSLALPKDLLPGQHTLQIGSLNEQGRLVTISIPISIKGSVSVGTFRGFVAIFTKDLEGQELTAKVAGKWIKQNTVRKFKNFGYSRLTRLTGAGYDIVIDVYINKKFYKRFKTRTR